MRVLIITVEKDIARFKRKAAAESVLQAFEACGIEWIFHIPWEPFKDDFDHYDAALCWSYYGGKHNIAYWAKKFEQKCRERRLPIVNSIDGYFRDHSHCLSRWKEVGIPCANYQFIECAEDIKLQFPLILRRDGQHRGRNLFLANNLDEAHKIIERNRKAYLNVPRTDKKVRPLDLAIEFIDVKASDGYYHKRRAIVIGDELIWREAAISTHWLVNEEHLIQNEYTRKINRQYIEEGDPNPDLILSASKALGSDMCALDYTLLDDGRYFFWEGNRHFQMYGNKNLDKNEIHPATGRTYEERIQVDLSVGKAIVKLIYKNINES